MPRRVCLRVWMERRRKAVREAVGASSTESLLRMTLGHLLVALAGGVAAVHRRCCRWQWRWWCSWLEDDAYGSVQLIIAAPLMFHLLPP